jgi:ornithine cyclodeaminase/alanine dehydrogenase
MKDVMEIVEEGFRQFALGNVKMPLRPTIRIERSNGLLTYMPAYIGGIDALAVKVVSIYPDNPTYHQLPTIQGTVLMNDPETGALLSIMEGGFITAMRTGAVSGLATKYLAKKDAKVAGIFGCGVQARTQLLAVNEARRLESVKAYDPLPDVSEMFCEEMSRRLDIEMIQADTPEDVVTDSDIIITATVSKEPVFKGEWLESGSHVNGVGSHHGPGWRELDETTIKRAKIVVDSKEACLKEAGDIVDPIQMGIVSHEHIYAELGEIIIGKKKARIDDQEITVFKSVGLALQDAATSIKAYENAKRLNVGETVSL